MGNVRLRINLAQREFEVEGDEAFVTRWAERLEERLAAAPDQPPTSQAAGVPAAVEPFGAYLLRLPRTATEVDRMLAAGAWIQHQAADDAFGTADASRLLSEHGVRIGNPSQAVRQSLQAKRLFPVQKGRYRVSLPGRQYLDRMLARSSDI